MSDLPPTRVALLGVGLIGGSLGLAWRKYAPQVTVVGLDDAPSLARALERGAIHQGAADVETAVRNAQVVVLAAPIGTNMRLLRAAAPHLAPDALVTDVGSVKTPIADYARQMLPGHCLFVGGHPMTGSERRGVEHADALLFENAAYVLCPEGDVEQDPRYLDLVALVETTGARVLPLAPGRHDRIAAAISHLPQLLSVALVNHADEAGRDDPALARLAAGGFRDMTRIASSPFEMWRDILAGNSGPILDELAGFARTFEALRNRIAADDSIGVAEAFRRAADSREKIPKHSKGFLEPLSDVFVYTPDEPGALYHITKALHTGDISIKDIELLKIREGTGGTFRLGFPGDPDADRAVAVLLKAGIQAYRL